MTIESILCPCGNELEISATVCCKDCNREVLTKRELQEKSASLSSQIHALRMEQAKIDIELFQRREHRPSRPFLLYEDFFKGVKKAKREDKGKVGTSRDFKAEAKALLEGMDL